MRAGTVAGSAFGGGPCDFVAQVQRRRQLRVNRCPVGMRAPSELFRAAPALRALAHAAALALEPSWDRPATPRRILD